MAATDILYANVSKANAFFLVSSARAFASKYPQVACKVDPACAVTRLNTGMAVSSCLCLERNCIMPSMHNNTYKLARMLAPSFPGVRCCSQRHLIAAPHPEACKIRAAGNRDKGYSQPTGAVS